MYLLASRLHAWGTAQPHTPEFCYLSIANVPGGRVGLESVRARCVPLAGTKLNGEALEVIR
jgi:hypothetical protein